MKKRALALLLCASMAVTCLGGCSKGDNASAAGDTTKDTQATTTAAGTEPGTSQAEAPAGETTEGLSSIFPLEEPVTLTYYIKANSAMTATMESYADVEFFKELEEKTNVHIEWNHNTSDEGFALMIASGELPDMINWNLGKAAGGVPALLEDNVIIDLTELLPKYAPNYYNWMKKNPEEDKAFKLDDGTYYQFVNFNCDWENEDIVYFKILGPQIRQDWLDKVNMKMPTTTDELYDVLCAFRDNDVNGNGDPNDEIPYVISTDYNSTLWSMGGSFGTRNDFQMLDGEVVYGPLTDNYKEYITYMNKLYTEGLINTDFAVNKDSLNMLMQDRAGFTIASMGSGLIATHDALKQENPEANYVSVPWLKGPKGHQSFTQDSNANPRSTAITTACKNPEIALAWLDYAYSYAGSMGSTFGIEGKSYEFVDGYPTIMDEVKQNDKGWSEEQSISRWMLGSINYPNARDYRFYEQINLNEDYKVDIQTNWNLATEEITLPPIVLTSEEASVYSDIMADVTTYVDECSLKFIIGSMSLENDWDSFVGNIKSMGIDKALECKRAAYERYQGR